MSTVEHIGRNLHCMERRGGGFIALIGVWIRRVSDRDALATMGDRSLRDIGLTRYDAYNEARKPFWRA
jgi:uncharacterized protein YjiS (DUF1127 family)